jgi:hypothetical protein
MAKRWYATRGLVKRACGISGSEKDAQVDAHIEAASREIDNLINSDGTWGFIPATTTRSYAWRQPDARNVYTLMLDAPLLSATALTKEGDDVTVIASTDYFLEPVNIGPPYHWIEIDLASSAFYSAKDTHQRQLRVTGSWGLGQDTKAAGALAEEDDGSETALDVTDSSLIDVGDCILIGTEQMFVSAMALLDTTANTNGALTADSSETTVTVTDGTLVKAGEVITINSEKMRVVSISGNDLAVERSYDGSVLAAHSDAQDVYAPRTLTVTRGENGTTAASHSTAAAISKYAPPADVAGLCQALATAYYFAEQGGWTGMVGASAEASVETKHAALIKRKEQVRRNYQRRLVGAV